MGFIPTGISFVLQHRLNADSSSTQVRADIAARPNQIHRRQGKDRMRSRGALNDF